MKQCIKKVLSYILTLSVILSLAVTNDISNVNAAEKCDLSEWDICYWDKGDGNYLYYKPTEIVNIDGKKALKLTNDTNDFSRATKKFKVKKNTEYQVSALVKYKGYKFKSNDEYTDSGAWVGMLGTNSGCENAYHKNGWKRVSNIINSGNNEEIDIGLFNSIWNGEDGKGYCKGTAYFTDIRVCENVSKKTNESNIAVFIFKNVDAPKTKNTPKCKDSLTEKDVNGIKGAVNSLYSDVPLLSENLWKIKCIDIFEIEKPVKKLAVYDESAGSYRLEWNAAPVSTTIDKTLNKAEKTSGKRYNFVIAVAPLSDVSVSWWGLGGGEYKSGVNSCLVTHKTGNDWYWDNNFPCAVFVHEMLHSLERESKALNPEMSCDLHLDGPSWSGVTHDYEHGKKGWDDQGYFYSDYMRSKTPGGRGIDKRVYTASTGYEWKTLYGKNTKVKYKKTDISTLKCSVPKNQVYTGKELNPKITVKDKTKVLKEGKDYTYKYYDNVEVGLGVVVVIGKGKYSGKYAQTFRINPSKPGEVVEIYPQVFKQ